MVHCLHLGVKLNKAAKLGIVCILCIAIVSVIVWFVEYFKQ